MVEGPDPYLRLTDPDPDGPKPYGSGSRTLLLIFVVENRWVSFHLGGPEVKIWLIGIQADR